MTGEVTLSPPDLGGRNRNQLPRRGAGSVDASARGAPGAGRPFDAVRGLRADHRAARRSDRHHSTAETAYALSTRAQTFAAGLNLVMITKRGSGFPEAIETVDKESAETYTISYTTALLALAMLAKELGADGLTDDDLGAVPGAVAAALAEPGIDGIALPERLLVWWGRDRRP